MNRIEHRESKWFFPFVEYSPKNRKDGLPMMIQLHGAGERGEGGDDLVLVDKHGFTKIIADRDIDCIVIMPQCPKGDFWAGRVESILKFIDQLIDEYSPDESAISLTGSSMGGYGTWFTAMARPEKFSAIAPVCGGGMAWSAGVLDMPIWAFHGDNDKTVSPTQSREMVQRLKENGKDVKYTEFAGEGHSIQRLAYTQELLDFLLSKRRLNK